jgi:hypothetical protein
LHELSPQVRAQAPGPQRICLAQARAPHTTEQVEDREQSIGLRHASSPQFTEHAPGPHAMAVGHAFEPTHRMSQLVARVQSTRPLQLPLPHSTRHATPAGHTTVFVQAFEPVQSRTHVAPSQVPFAQAVTHAGSGGRLPESGTVPASLAPPLPDAPPVDDAASRFGLPPLPVPLSRDRVFPVPPSDVTPPVPPKDDVPAPPPWSVDTFVSAGSRSYPTRPHPTAKTKEAKSPLRNPLAMCEVRTRATIRGGARSATAQRTVVGHPKRTCTRCAPSVSTVVHVEPWSTTVGGDVVVSRVQPFGPSGMIRPSRWTLSKL